MRLLPLLLLLLTLPAIAQTSSEAELILDATYVPCGDSTETLLIFKDGRAVYAYGNQGVMFPLGPTITADLSGAVDRASSVVDKESLDSCTTVGVILPGPRYMLINTRRPSAATRDLQSRMEQIRRYARRKLPMIERLSNRAGESADTTIDSEPWVESNELLENVAPSPIAREWRCRGAVQVSVQVDRQGKARQVFVENADVKGKCSSLLTATAIRAVMESSFTPAVKNNGRNTAGWMHVEVRFGR